VCNKTKIWGHKRTVKLKTLSKNTSCHIEIYIFSGAEECFFNKPKVKYNIVNDLDSDVDHFQVVSNNKEELEKAFIYDACSFWFTLLEENKEDPD
jgi:hypothetical protein